MSRLIACALAMSVLCPCSPVRADAAEDKAIAFVEKFRGEAIRDENAPGKPVVAVKLSRTKVTDAGLKELAPFTHLTFLDLGYTKVTKGGVAELREALPKCDISGPVD